MFLVSFGLGMVPGVAWCQCPCVGWAGVPGLMSRSASGILVGVPGNGPNRVISAILANHRRTSSRKSRMGCGLTSHLEYPVWLSVQACHKWCPTMPVTMAGRCLAIYENSSSSITFHFPRLSLNPHSQFGHGLAVSQDKVSGQETA